MSFSVIHFSDIHFTGEKDALTNKLEKLKTACVSSLPSNGDVVIVISGDISRLPEKTQKTIQSALEKTKGNTRFYFNICLNYGGKAEIVRAAQLFAQDVKDGKHNP